MASNATTGEMKTMASCLNKLAMDGYTENFQVTEDGLFSSGKDKYYKPEEVSIVNFFRFEGDSDPADNSILYAIETNDSAKGTLTDAYGPYADPETDKFIKRVENIEKKKAKKSG